MQEHLKDVFLLSGIVSQPDHTEHAMFYLD